MNLSFQEKSILGSLVITISLFSYYFLAIFDVLTGATSAAQLPIVLFGVVIAMIVVEVIYHIFIALQDRRADEDERDRLIQAKATRIAYFVLVTGCMTLVGHSMFMAVYSGAENQLAMQSPLVLSSLIVCSFIVAEIVGFSMQLYYYRRGF